VEVLLGVLAVAGVLGVFGLALWRWREYLIGYFVGGGGNPAAGADSDSGSSEGGASSPTIDHAIASDHAGHHSEDAGGTGGDDY